MTQTIIAENSAKNSPIDPKDAYVLVVEDNLQNLVLIARLLAFIGVRRYEWKASGWQVLEFADTMPRVDLVLMDLHLPYEDGYDALAKLRNDTRVVLDGSGRFGEINACVLGGERFSFEGGSSRRRSVSRIHDRTWRGRLCGISGGDPAVVFGSGFGCRRFGRARTGAERSGRT